MSDNKAINIFDALIRPTADLSTYSRTYKSFKSKRLRTENYDEDRIGIIGNLGQVLVRFQKFYELGQYVNTLDNNFELNSTINIDPIVIPFCELKNIVHTFEIYYALIYTVFEGLVKLKIDFVIDPDMENYQEIVFELTVRGEPANVLNHENKFYSRIKELIPSADRRYFSLTYIIL